MKNVRQTTNTGLLIGTLSEKNTEIKQIELTKDDNTKFKCNAVQGNIVVSTVNGDFNLRVNCPECKKDGTKTKLYANFETLHNSYVSAVEAAKDKSLTPSIIGATVGLSCWDRYNQNSGKMVSSPQIRLRVVNRENSDAESQTDFSLEGVIRSIKPEMTIPKSDTEEAEETGRLLVEFITINFNSEAEPYSLIVPEDLAEAFVNGWTDDEGTVVNGYAVGDTCCLGVELVMRHVGDEKKKSAGFGRKAKVAEGFDVLELVVIGGEPAYTDDTEDEKKKPFTPEVMKELMNERKMKLEKIEKDAKENKDSGSSQKSSGKGLGGRKPNVNMADMGDAPF
jgi:hypothetical protein